MTEIQTERLVGFGTFDDLSDQILSRLFGQLVLRAASVVKDYHSDLFHDAEWLRVRVTGPTTIYFVAREYGTHVAATESVLEMTAADPTAMRYEVVLRDDNGTWYADFIQHG